MLARSVSGHTGPRSTRHDILRHFVRRAVVGVGGRQVAMVAHRGTGRPPRPRLLPTRLNCLEGLALRFPSSHIASSLLACLAWVALALALGSSAPAGEVWSTAAQAADRVATHAGGEQGHAWVRAEVGAPRHDAGAGGENLETGTLVPASRARRVERPAPWRPASQHAPDDVLLAHRCKLILAARGPPTT